MRRQLGRMARRTAIGRGALRRVKRVLTTRQNLVTAQRLVDGGLVDASWYEAQTGLTFPSAFDVAIHYLSEGRVKGFAIHPLLEPASLARTSWHKSRLDPVLKYLDGEPGRSTPHPFFDEADYLRRHPEAATHPGRGIGHFMAAVTDDTPLPIRPDVHVEAPLWSPWRARVVDAAAKWAVRRVLTVPRVASRWDTSAEAEYIAGWAARSLPEEPGLPRVSVVMPVRNRPVMVATAIESIQAQTMGSWELIVVDDGSTDDTPEVVAALAAADPRIRLFRRANGGVCVARNAGLAEARGHYISFLDSDNTWRPRFLEVMTSAMHGLGSRAAHAAVEIIRESGSTFRGFAGGRDHLLVVNHIPLIALVVERDLLTEVGNFDESLRRWVDHDLLLRIAEHADLDYVPMLGAEVDETSDHDDRITDNESEGWGLVVLQKHLIDWDALREGLPARVAGRTSILIPTFNDWVMTVAAVDAVLATTTGLDVEVVVLNNGGGRNVSVMLAGLLGGLPNVTIRDEPTNRNFALGSNLAFAESTGQNVVFLNNDTLVRPGWLPPLLEEIADPGVLAAQPLLTYADGTIQCAGIYFPGGGSLPSHFLANHPIEDAVQLGRFSTRALTGAAFAIRADLVVDMQGFDPMYINGWEDIDLCLRLSTAHPDATFRVVSDSRVEHLESKTPGRGKFIVQNRRVFLDRWRDATSEGDDALWHAAGFDVVTDHTLETDSADSVVATRPVVARSATTAAGTPRPLRWAIKIAAHAGPRGDAWGDTFFAADLAEALRRLGQEVVVDRRDAYYRETSHLDDVTVTIRGLDTVVPAPGPINLLWVISHPDLVTPEEMSSYDAVFAASIPWARTMSGLSRVGIDPLLQATDPTRFHPVADGPAGHDVLFGGNYRANRPVVADAISAGIDLSMYGRGWRDAGLGAHVRGDYLPNDELGTAYAAAGVILCDHWIDMAREGFAANRLFDAVASGARVVSDRVEGLDDVFGPLVRPYQDVADLARIVGPDRETSFLPDDERHEQARQFGIAHSFDARARVLIDRVLDLQRARGQE